ncbi:fimbriae protein TadE/F [Pontimonas salivibrio]|uniref:Fimbriae protein TadE/F n=1 Tax=Pontimonas salivibrio TaxID=1159327 RepID=A0A2L2BRY9_9MICO|nr:hypothetical protein [Pontimonas salivibrio]AVG24428.1 fimbriae protein TadE/F [Pontimonas salivibrio]
MVRSVWKLPPHWSDPTNRLSLDAGRASLEFLVAGVILFIPLVLLTVSLWGLQQAALATDAAARYGVRVFTQHTALSSAVPGTQRAISHTLETFSIDHDVDVSLMCRPTNGCLDPGSWVEITVVADVPLGSIPLIPAALPFSVPITGVAQAQVSDYRGDP